MSFARELIYNFLFANFYVAAVTLRVYFFFSASFFDALRFGYTFLYFSKARRGKCGHGSLARGAISRRLSCWSVFRPEVRFVCSLGKKSIDDCIDPAVMGVLT